MGLLIAVAFALALFGPGGKDGTNGSLGAAGSDGAMGAAGEDGICDVATCGGAIPAIATLETETCMKTSEYYNMDSAIRNTTLPTVLVLI